MKVLDLRCQNGHVFEGWFASDDDFMAQNGRGLIECPLCTDKLVVRTPTAPRLNLSGAKAPVEAQANSAVTKASAPTSSAAVHSAPSGVPTLPAEMQAAWIAGLRQLMARTEDVGPRFAEEARRIHYGEIPSRGIRGQATPEDRAALQEEGIETLAIPVPRGLDGPLQ